MSCQYVITADLSLSCDMLVTKQDVSVVTPRDYGDLKY